MASKFEPGPQIDRVNSAPEGGATTLTDPSLFDGSKNDHDACRTCHRMSQSQPRPRQPGKPEADAPTNTKREEPPAGNTKTTLIDTGKKVETGERPAALTIDPASYDDLKRIKGIGPKNEDALNELGIYTFKQIAEWTPENVDWVEDFMSFPGRIEREDWIAQAKTLAEGGETEFSKRVDAGDVPSSQEDED
jgi:NADH-quinone oxidoreductase subunit E